ncbi:MAG: PepSY-like domain-containing protein [Verrucomicrobiota bacterium]
MKIILLLSTLMLASAIALPVLAGETDLPFEKLPAKVQKTMKRLVGPDKITKTTKETEKDGRILYEVAYRDGEKKFEAEVSPEGELLVVDEELTLATTPAGVRKAIKEVTAGGKIGKIEKATKGKEVYYEAEFKKGGDDHEVKVAPNGKIISTE